MSKTLVAVIAVALVVVAAVIGVVAWLWMSGFFSEPESASTDREERRRERETAEDYEIEYVGEPVSIRLSADEGADISHESGARIVVPAGAVSEATTVLVAEVVPPESSLQVGRAFDFSVRNAELLKPVTVYIPIERDWIDHTASIHALHWNDEFDDWESVEGIVNKSLLAIAVTTDDLSLFTAVSVKVEANCNVDPTTAQTGRGGQSITFSATVRAVETPLNSNINVYMRPSFIEYTRGLVSAELTGDPEKTETRSLRKGGSPVTLSYSAKTDYSGKYDFICRLFWKFPSYLPDKELTPDGVVSVPFDVTGEGTFQGYVNYDGSQISSCGPTEPPLAGATTPVRVDGHSEEPDTTGPVYLSSPVMIYKDGELVHLEFGSSQGNTFTESLPIVNGSYTFDSPGHYTIDCELWWHAGQPYNPTGTLEERAKAIGRCIYASHFCLGGLKALRGVTTRNLEVASARWSSGGVRVSPSLLPKEGGNITVRAHSESSSGVQISAPTISIDALGLRLPASSCGTTDSDGYVSRCWEADFTGVNGIPANNQSGSQRYEITIASSSVPGPDQAAYITVAAPPPPPPPGSDRLALVALYESTSGSRWRNNVQDIEPWLVNDATSSISEWYGVFTNPADDRQVVGLFLEENCLEGTLPPEIGNMVHLTDLTLQWNARLGCDGLKGPIPSSVGRLTRLLTLDLSENELEGEIPSSIGDNLLGLDLLDLSDNRLSGEIPASLGNLVNLTELDLSENRLEGQIPAELGRLTNLYELRLAGGRNEFEGCIPPALLEVDDNDLSELGLEPCEADEGGGGFTPPTYNAPGTGPGETSQQPTVTPISPAFAHNPGQDFDGLRAAGNATPEDFWSDGTTVWVSDSRDRKIYAYNLATKQRNSAQDFNTLASAGNTSAHGIWSDGTTMWVAHNTNSSSSKIFAYNLATKQRDNSKDFDTLADAGNTRPDGIWSDGTTMWVADWNDGKLYAYSLATRQRDPARDFDTLAAAGNNNPDGVWSDGTTMWVSDPIDRKIYAYSFTTKQRDSARDFDTLASAGNTNPAGIWSDGSTMWVTDWGDGKIYAYNMPPGTSSGAAISTTPTGPAFARNPAQDFNTPRAAGNATPEDFWSDGTTVWVSDSRDRKIYAYNLATKQRDRAQDFDTLAAAGNSSPHGIWSDGTTMWVAHNTNSSSSKIFAYNLATKQRDNSKDFDTLADAGNTRPDGIWSDGTTMWVADWNDGKLYAYSLATRQRDPARDFDTLAAAGNNNPDGVWSDGTTMWVSDPIDRKIYAYNFTTKQRDSARDFDTLASAGNTNPAGIWSDGSTMWVTDWGDGKIYAYNMPPGTSSGPAISTTPTGPAFARNPAQDFNTLASAGISYPWGLWSDGATLWVSGDRHSGIYAFDMATKARKEDLEFHTLSQHGNNYALGLWSDGATMWVADFHDDKIYAYELASKARSIEKEFDTLMTAGQNDPTGIWSDGTTMWVADYRDGKIYAYDLATKTRLPSSDFNTLSSAGNRHPEGIWSDGTTMWVSNSHTTGKWVYAYDMATKIRLPGKEFDTLTAAGQRDPKGLWSDGSTLWVTDLLNRKVYAYNMPSGTASSATMQTGAGGSSLVLSSLALDEWLLMGSSRRTPDGSIQLTPARNEQVGFLFHPLPVSSRQMRIEFSFEIGRGSGADGISPLLRMMTCALRREEVISGVSGFQGRLRWNSTRTGTRGRDPEITLN